MADPILLAKAVGLASNENARKTVGWIIVAVLSPLIVVLAFLISYGAGSASSNISTVELCFYGGPIPDSLPEEYRARLEQTQNSLFQLDSIVDEINQRTENSESLDAVRVKALFYALYFGAGSQPDPRQFADCFVRYEERPGTEEDENYTVAVPIENMEQVYQNIRSVLGVEPAAEQLENADSIYDLIRYGYTGGSTASLGPRLPSSARTASAPPSERTGGMLSPLNSAAAGTPSPESGGDTTEWIWQCPPARRSGRRWRERSQRPSMIPAMAAMS